MSNEIKGILKVIGEVQSFASGFKKLQFVIETVEQYPQMLAFDLMKDDVAFADSWNLGARLKVSYNVRGNEYNGKYYVGLVAWKIIPAQEQGQPRQQAQQQQAPPQNQQGHGQGPPPQQQQSQQPNGPPPQGGSDDW